ncbi:hypothetical protein QA123_001984 [Staphylococcus aureus]|nr:hypothetical protein [Staphylococcus aureus]EKS0132655.1 hypothetical protein [Staphylococcus aureus]EKS0143166.1 hypothetical protein [Staphylococcus aureus]EKS0291057.1 hypothetical protein [Staphylococcus aureus]ELG8224170.1 hypothetical protein [Staphylococcus aureus]
MTNTLDTLIALSKEYTRLLEERKQNKYNVKETRLKRTGLVLRQTMIDLEKGGMENE